jgi:hypothetical protein
MAQIVGAFSTPHNPFLPTRVPRERDGADAHGFAAVGEALRASRPDVIVSFSPDHLNTFFFDNLPQLAIGIVPSFEGPLDPPPNVPHRSVSSDPELAAHLFTSALEAGFDPARSNRLDVDHSLIVQLQMLGLTGADAVAVVPIILNVLVPPIIPTERACEFGAAIGAAIRAYDSSQRVALLANGGINQEIGGPKVREGGLDGAPDSEWFGQATDALRAGAIDLLRAAATSARLMRAGNAAGEMLTVLAMLPALGDPPPARELIPEPVVGHCYGVWIPE